MTKDELKRYHERKLDMQKLFKGGFSKSDIARRYAISRQRVHQILTDAPRR